jgi:flagellar protein FliS
MGFDVNNPYFRNEVLTASPQKLRLLLLDGCIAFITDGRDAMDRRDFETIATTFGQARDILIELITGMDRDANPELCDKFAAVYTFVFKHLTEASLEKDLAKVDECLRIMRYERETWAMAMERGAALQQADHAAESAAADDAPSTPRSPVKPTGPGSATGTYGPPSGRPGGGQGLSFSA